MAFPWPSSSLKNTVRCIFLALSILFCVFFPWPCVGGILRALAHKKPSEVLSFGDFSSSTFPINYIVPLLTICLSPSNRRTYKELPERVSDTIRDFPKNSGKTPCLGLG